MPDIVRETNSTGEFEIGSLKITIQFIEEKQNELIELLRSQIIDLTMMSKIELGDDVIIEVNRISEEIQEIINNK